MVRGQPDDALEQLIDEITDRLASGQRIDWEAWERAHPEHAHRLHTLLPALKGMSTLRQAATRAAGASRRPPPTLGDFRLVREIAHGGMGVVYEAEQLSLSRRVALKILPYASVLDSRQLVRFQNEAQAAAQLDHPHIVSVIAFGCERGVYYYAMQYVEGRSLAELIDELREERRVRRQDAGIRVKTSSGGDQLETSQSHDHEPQAESNCSPVPRSLSPVPSPPYFRHIAELGVQIAEALEYAHQHGVVHRDVKPANLLLDRAGDVWITDFGLARSDGKETLTKSGDVLGTLRYMSPEQAGGHRAVVDERTDIYSLGATLYELLTLQPVFGRKHDANLVREITEAEPQSPRRLAARLPRDLETIVLKALEKHPEDRYASAQALANDLGSFLRDEPIQAQPPTALQRLVKWSHRHKELTASLMVILAIAVLCLATASILIGSALDRTRFAQAQTLRQRDTALNNLYIANMRLAQEEWDNGHLDVVHSLLNAHLPDTSQADLRGWEWYYLKGLCHYDIATLDAHPQTVTAVAWSPDGQRLLTASVDCTMKLWDANTQRQLTTLIGHSALIWSAEWSPDGRWVASASWDNTVRIWDASNGVMKLQLNARTSNMRDVAWSPDAKQLATCGEDGFVRTWDARTGEKLLEMEGHDGLVWSVDWSPDGTRLASVGNYRKRDLRIWDAATGAQVKEILNAHGHYIAWVSWSPTGEKLATVSPDQRVKVWDATSGEQLWEADSKNDAVCVSWSPDENVLATSGSDAAVKLWDADTGRQLRIIRGHIAPVNSVAWRPDGRRLASGAADGTVKIWDPDQEQTSTLVATGAGDDWSSNGRQIACTAHTDADGKRPCIDVVDASTAQVVDRYFTKLPAESRLGLIVWSRDGKRIAYLAFQEDLCTIEIVEYPGWARLLSLPVLQGPGEVRSIAWSRDDCQLAAAVCDYRVETSPVGHVMVWDTASGTPVKRVWHDQYPSESVAWSPDGSRLASGSWDHSVVIWSTVTWRELMKLEREPQFVGYHPGGEGMLAWSRDGKRLAAATAGGWVIVWDVATGREALSFSGHTGAIHAIAMSPDDTRIATGGTDRKLKIWDAATGAHLLTMGGTSPFQSIKWSPDGARLLTRGGGIRVWDGSPVSD